MSTIMDNIEEQCEDAVFEVCDARERFPEMCTNELVRLLKIQSEIAMAPVKPQVVKTIETSFVNCERKIVLETIGIESEGETLLNEESAKQWKTLSSKVNDLKIVAEQISSEKYCEINVLLRNKFDD